MDDSSLDVGGDAPVLANDTVRDHAPAIDDTPSIPDDAPAGSNDAPATRDDASEAPDDAQSTPEDVPAVDVDTAVPPDEGPGDPASELSILDVAGDAPAGSNDAPATGDDAPEAPDDAQSTPNDVPAVDVDTAVPPDEGPGDPAGEPSLDLPGPDEAGDAPPLCVLENCDDDNPCTADTCDSALGCVNLPIPGIHCCTPGGGGWECAPEAPDCCHVAECESNGPGAGLCRYLEMVCDSGDACEIGHCDVDSCSCMFAPVPVDDGDACTVDWCDSSRGVLHEPRNCSDDWVCSFDYCDPAVGCVHERDSGMDCCFTTAEEEHACLAAVPDCCHEALCLASPPAESRCWIRQKDCDDGDPCHVGACFQVDGTCGCVFQDVDVDDGDPCTEDSCQRPLGVLHLPIGCDDGVPCTVDNCDPLTGDCVHTAPPETCNAVDDDCDGATDDGDLCPAGSTCIDGSCQPACLPDRSCDVLADACTGPLLRCDHLCMPAGTPVNCPATDSGSCAGNVCDFATGLCRITAWNDGSRCTDGDPATIGDVCVAGACLGTAGPTECLADADCPHAPPCDWMPCDVDVPFCGEDGLCHDLVTPWASDCFAHGGGGSVCALDFRQGGIDPRCFEFACETGTRAWWCINYRVHECCWVDPRLPTLPANPTCDDGDPCTVDTCRAGVTCDHVPAGEALYPAPVSLSLTPSRGWTFDTTSSRFSWKMDTVGDLRFATGAGIFPLRSRLLARATMPPMILPDAGPIRLTFELSQLATGFEEFRVLVNGEVVPVMLAEAPSGLPSWWEVSRRPATVDLDAWAGQAAKVTFAFDSGTALKVEPGEVFVRNIRVTRLDCP